jgi:hypothetical protein
VGHLVGVQLVEVRDRVEKALIEAYAIPEAARSISVSLARVSVPMEEALEDSAERAPRALVGYVGPQQASAR